MSGSLEGKSVLVIGRGSGIARAIVEAAIGEGASVTVAGRDAQKLRDAYPDGSVAYAVITVVIPTLPASGSVTLPATGCCARWRSGRPTSPPQR